MKEFVLDCSMTMSWCFVDESTELSENALTILRKAKAIVPNIWSLEVLNVLRVAERKKRISRDETNDFVRILGELPIEVDIGIDEILNTKILRISREYSLSAYDAAYLELAQRKEIPLITLDKILSQAAEKAGVQLSA